MAGAVLRPSGSISVRAPLPPASASCCVAMKRKSALVSSTGAANAPPDSRATVFWNRLVSPKIRANCFG